MHIFCIARETQSAEESVARLRFCNASSCKQRFRSRFNTLFAGARKASIDRDRGRRFFRRPCITLPFDFYYFPDEHGNPASDKHGGQSEDKTRNQERFVAGEFDLRSIRSHAAEIERNYDMLLTKNHSGFIKSHAKAARPAGMPPPREYRAFARSNLHGR